MEIDPKIIKKDEEEEIRTILEEQEDEQEISQTGSSKVTSNSSSFEKEEDTPAMGDETFSSCKQAFNDINPTETDGEGRAGPTSTTTTIIEEIEEGIGILNLEEEEDDIEEGESRRISNSDSIEITFPSTKKELSVSFSNNNKIIEDQATAQQITVNSDDEDHNNNNNNSTEEDDDENTPPITTNDDDKNKGGSENNTKPTKIILRMLPPKITTQEFIDSVSPLPEYDYVQVDNPDPEWGAANSVAHINFINSDDAFWFLERFSGYQFIDEQGHSHIALGDFAMSQKIFRPPPNNKNTSTNLERGKLLESEEYIEFLQKYEENPFAFKVGLPLREMKTTEQMVTEIDSRPKRKGPEATPLTEFILNKKSRREADRMVRRDRDRERRKTDKQRRDRELDRDMKKERKRDRRDKERKEKRERERLEKEAKSKGMTVTYSKTGKVTRWSANSGPFTKKKEDDRDFQEDNSADRNIKQSYNPIPSSSQKEKENNYYEKQQTSHRSKFNETSGFGGKKSLINPFSKDAKKIEKPREDDKPKYVKPFPVKSEQTSSTATLKSEPFPNKQQKPEASSSVLDKDNKDYNITKKEPFPSSTAAGATKKNEENVSSEAIDHGQPKKKIIKKIIRVRKVKKEEGGGGGDISTTDSKTTTIKKVVQSSTKRDESNKDKTSLSNTEGSNTETVINKQPLPSSSSDTNPSENKDEKRRRARPDMQIYRPGSLRKENKDGGNSQALPPPRNGRNRPSSSNTSASGSAGLSKESTAIKSNDTKDCKNEATSSSVVKSNNNAPSSS